MDVCSSDDEDMCMTVALNRLDTLNKFQAVTALMGMLYTEKNLNKTARKDHVMSGYG